MNGVEVEAGSYVPVPAKLASSMYDPAAWLSIRLAVAFPSVPVAAEIDCYDWRNPKTICNVEKYFFCVL